MSTIAGHAQESWSRRRRSPHIAREPSCADLRILGAFGRVIDLNPLLNPYIDRTSAFQPKNAAPYLDRSP